MVSLSSALLLSSKEEERYLRTLRRAANHTSYGKYKMVAGVWRGSSFIGWGENLYRVRRGGETLHPDYAFKGIHAELDALTSLETKRATLYIAGISKTGYEISSYPCERCKRLIKNSNLKYIIYNLDGTIIKTSVEAL